jgi:signal peptidase I
MQERRKSNRGTWTSVLVTALLALAFSYFIGTTVGIAGDSMEPSLHSGERAVVPRYETWLHRLGVGSFARGEIVFFPSPAAPGGLCPFFCEYLIKRVVATGGDTVSISNGQLLVNGAAQDEPYLGDTWRGSYNLPEQVVPEDHVFVLGDNRAPYGSRDSRNFGPVPEAHLVGRAAAVIWPLLRRDAAGTWHLNPRPL